MPASPLLRILLIAQTVALCAGFPNWLHPALDSIGHFRLHLFVTTASFAIVALATSSRRLAFAVAGIWTIAALLHSMSLGQFPALPAPASIVAVEARPAGVYRLLQINVRFDNEHHGEIVTLIRDSGADIVAVEEVNAAWEDSLAALDGLYASRVTCRTDDHDGVAILSRHAFAGDAASRCLEQRVMALATVDLDGTRLTVGAVHLDYPWPFTQAKQIDRLSADLRTLRANAIVAGDFNATPWSAALARFARQGNLVVVPSVGATWLFVELPAWLRFAGLPIDHVLHGDGVSVRSVQKIAVAGSDHDALVVDFAMDGD